MSNIKSTVRRRRLASRQRPPPTHSTANEPSIPNHPNAPPPRLHVAIRGQIPLPNRHHPHSPPQTHHDGDNDDPLRRRNRNHARKGIRPAPRPRLLRLLLRLNLKTPRRPRHPGQPPLLDQPRPRHTALTRLGRHVLLCENQRSGTGRRCHHRTTAPPPQRHGPHERRGRQPGRSHRAPAEANLCGDHHGDAAAGAESLLRVEQRGRGDGARGGRGGAGFVDETRRRRHQGRSVGLVGQAGENRCVNWR